MSNVLGDQELQALLEAIEEGSRVLIKYHHHADQTQTLRSIRGVLLKHGPKWIIKASRGNYKVIPSRVVFIHAVSVIESLSRTPSVRRDDELDFEEMRDATELGDNLRPRESALPHLEDDEEEVLPLQPSQPAQPRAAGPRTTIQHHSRPTRHPQALQDIQLELSSQRDLLNQLITTMTNQLPQRQADHHDRRATVDPGQDVTMMMRSVGEVFRGTEQNPSWRFVDGIATPRYIPEKFMICSIPHLIFKEDPLTLRMVKVPKGTAVPAYKAMLSNCKLQFPNMVTMRVQRGRNDRRDDRARDPEVEAGIRAQLERAERMFCDLLARLDNVDEDQMPRSKADWMVFMDAGCAVLDLYSTLANGFPKGGAKVASTYSGQITTGGRYDPVKLWQGEAHADRAFRGGS